MSNRLVELELFAIRLPFRHKFSHAAAERDASDTVIAAAVLADGTVGFGEGVPRSYVTGETVDSVLENIEHTLAGHVAGMAPKTFGELLERLDRLPFVNGANQIINSARCCVELALLDAYSRHFGCSLAHIVGWLGFGGFAGRANIGDISVTGVLDGRDPGRLSRQLRLMRWYGLRDFKLKVGWDHDQENLTLLHKRLGRALEYGEVTLRADANGAWDVDTASAMCEELRMAGVCCLEQPLAANDRDHYRVLADLTKLPLMADESLIRYADAEYLAQNDLVDYFNIRISKNGGLIPAVRMAELAVLYSRQYQLGAMVGETGILAAAGRHFLQMVPHVAFTEICYGTFLLADDVVDRKMRFGYGGKLTGLTGPGLGVNVKIDKIRKYMVQPSRKLRWKCL